MLDLPKGTVTFLFTDVEGSTRLLQEHGDAYADLLAEHRRVLRDAFTRHSGVEVDTQGDAFFVAFGRASDAISAAREAQAGLRDGPIRVRMGVHTGEPTVTDEGYVGIDVHRAARIAAAGHGGQVLMSQATRDLIDDAELRDLGEHRLKDLAAPVRVFQLGDGDFPPLKSLHQTNLPIVATPFVGREREVGELLALLRDSRLVTLTGPGGTGKTRLALQVAAEAAVDFEHGVFWVGLAPLREPELVLASVAQAVGAGDELAAYVGDKRLLVLVDNFEQVIEAAPALGDLLGACPNLKLLVTSREPLHLEGEWEYAVEPLREAEAVALFEQRARAVKRDFSSDGEVAEICRRLDCLPLAVELAAARAKMLSPAAILERLGQRLPLLTGGARNVPERQRTLRATIEWSYELLTPEDRQLFARLAVFAGGCMLEAAEDVCDADLDTLQALVDKSLVRQADERFWMLETIRELATERLRERSDLEDLRQRHAAHFLALAETAEAELRGAEQRVSLERLELDHDNLRAALAWARESGDTELGLRLAAPLWRFWRIRNHLAEGRRVLEELLEDDGSTSPALRARALVGASRLALDQGDSRRSVTLGEEALSAARASGAPREIAAATENLGIAMFVLTESAGGAALALLEESVEQFQALGDPAATADALNNLGSLLMDSGKSTRAREVLEEALALQREAGNVSGTEFTLHSLAYVALHDGDLEFARGLLEESIVLSHELGHLSGVGWGLDGLAHVAAGCNDDRRALVLWAAGESTRAEAGAEMQSSEAAIHEEAVARVRTRLGDEADPAWAEGAAMEPDDAIAYALADSPRRLSPA